MSMPRELPGQRTLTITGEVTNTPIMAVKEEATAVMTAAALMTGTGTNSVRLQGSSTG